MIKKNNLEKLLDISRQTRWHINNLINTYTRKEVQYFYRDTHSYQFDNIDGIHGDRAVKIISEYARRKCNYNPNQLSFNFEEEGQ